MISKNAINYLCNREGGQGLSPEDTADPDDRDLLVKDVLKDKCPPLREDNIMATNLKESDSIPKFHRVWIMEDAVEKVAGKLTGRAGLTGLDSFMMKELLLKHGQASAHLRSAVSNLESWLANENVLWAAYCGLMLCGEVAFDRMPGVCPLGIGEILCRLLAKCILEVTGQQEKSACGTNNLCAGLKLGCKGAIHGMSTKWDELSQMEDVGTLFIDGFNEFDKKSHINMLWQIHHR